MSNNISLGLYDSPRKLLEAIAKVVPVPTSLKVTDVSTGIMNQGQENERPWANLTAVDSDLYEQFKSIGQEEYCPTFKLKLKNYLGESLFTLQGQEISFEKYEVAFMLDKYKQPTGLALVIELADISSN